ncbi:MAG: NUDIX hydrolase [Oscillospiraceae bacterium]|nr:NUDIX hydrolase [Oscillospiraceae bacterium]
MDLKEKILSEDIKFKGRIFTAKVNNVELADGKKSTREVVAHSGGVAVIAADENKNILMVRQYRIAASDIILEIPAGKLEAGEDPYECGVRELKEETGCIADKMVHIGEFLPTPGYCTERINIYLATGLRQSEQNLDEGEFLEVERIPLDTLCDMVIKNEIKDAKTVIAVLRAKEILG